MSNFCTPCSPFFCLSELRESSPPSGRRNLGFHSRHLSVWNTYSRTRHLSGTHSRTRHQSGTLIAQPNTAWTLVTLILIISSGHAISVGPLPSPPVTIHFRPNFYHFLPDPPPPIYCIS